MAVVHEAFEQLELCRYRDPHLRRDTVSEVEVIMVALDVLVMV
jgi:hypothetical protein